MPLFLLMGCVTGVLLLQGCDSDLPSGAIVAERCDKLDRSAGESGNAHSQVKGPKVCILREMKDPTSEAVAWSSDGNRFATLSDLQRVISLTIWAVDGQIYRKFLRPEGGYSHLKGLAFVAHDSEIVTPPVSARDGQVAFDVLDIDSGRVIHEEPAGHPGLATNVNSIAGLAVTPDQSALAVIYGYAPPIQPVDVYDTRSWTKIATLPPPVLVLKNGDRAPEHPNALTFSPDGKLLAVGGGSAGDLFIYEWKAMRLVREFHSFGELTAFSPDSSLIAVATSQLNEGRRAPDGKVVPIGREKAVRVFRISDGTLVSYYPAPLPWITDLAWSSDGRTIAIMAGAGGAAGDFSKPLGSNDKTLPVICHSLRLWEPLELGSVPQTIALRGTCASGGLTIAFSPNANILAVNNDQYVTLFSIRP